MKRITLHTLHYKHELAEFAEDITKKEICTVQSTKNGTLFIWEISKAAAFVNMLLFLLQNIALQENPIFKHSKKLKNLTEGLQNTDIHNIETEKLTEYIKSNKELNLEGYATFRMAEYKGKLDSMLYGIIKKINLHK